MWWCRRSASEGTDEGIEERVCRNSERSPTEFMFRLPANKKISVVTNCDWLSPCGEEMMLSLPCYSRKKQCEADPDKMLSAYSCELNGKDLM